MADYDPSMIARLEERVTTGFAGVHQRLDVLNGQVARTTSWRIDHQQEHATRDAYAAGEKSGRVAITRRTIAVLATAGSILMVAVTTATQILITRALGGG